MFEEWERKWLCARQIKQKVRCNTSVKEMGEREREKVEGNVLESSCLKKVWTSLRAHYCNLFQTRTILFGTKFCAPARAQAQTKTHAKRSSQLNMSKQTRAIELASPLMTFLSTKINVIPIFNNSSEKQKSLCSFILSPSLSPSLHLSSLFQWSFELNSLVARALTVVSTVFSPVVYNKVFAKWL